MHSLHTRLQDLQLAPEPTTLTADTVHDPAGVVELITELFIVMADIVMANIVMAYKVYGLLML